ncbi:hypothetical protein EDB85DRAFT_2157573 [Lactarius pseudohatsudake]|nr:hypothetical protein EDB85DRAFT_2157573 [Lactarius pseudohatsudake]
MSGPPLDASGVLTLKLLHFLADRRPSAQEKRGDQRLDSARELARGDEVLISPGDLEIVRERITLTAEIKVGLESKRGLPRYLQAREYRKSAKETYKFVKSVSDRARDATLGLGQSSAVAVPHPTSGQRPRGFLAVPLQVTVQNPIPNDDFGASTEDDVGVVNHEQFSPMPISIIAITLTVIEYCIDEWSDGTQRDCNWDDAKFQTVYDSHFSSLVDFKHKDYEPVSTAVRSVAERAVG